MSSSPFLVINARRVCGLSSCLLFYAYNLLFDYIHAVNYCIFKGFGVSLYDEFLSRQMNFNLNLFVELIRQERECDFSIIMLS